MSPFLIVLAPLAAAPAAGPPAETIVVSATRAPEPAFGLPAAIDAVDARAIREGNPQVNLSEALQRVPGIVVNNRQNYAQDLQISSRGFGARSTFGVRGVRLIADGIPATMPDGQGQAATFDLASAERIEVLRGPLATLYGNSSGGVVQVFTADGPAEPMLEAGAMAASFGQHRENLRAGGDWGAVNALANLSRFSTHGWREHSAAVRSQLNAKVRLRSAGARVTFIANALEQPDTQDPLGLTRTQMEEDPRQADAAALAFDTRKTVRQAQAGMVVEAGSAARGRLDARAYYGERRVIQFLGFSGDTPTGSGGVVDLDRAYGGVGLRFTRRFGGSRPLELSLGADLDRLEERRRGFVNDAGRRGALRRDEDDVVSNTDFYGLADWRAAPAWRLMAGARASRVRFVSRDRYFTPANPDDSGSAEHSETSPVAGLLFAASERLHFYANAGSGFETPTFAELAYRPGGERGLHFALRPATSRHAEAGAKARFANGARLDAAAFRIRTRDEIVVDASVGGRTVFRNASRTLREGVELSAWVPLAAGFEASLAWAAIDARFRDDFVAGGDVVPAGRRLPGVPARTLFAELAWREPGGWHVAAELRHAGRVYVDDANSDAAEGYTVANLRAGFEGARGAWRWRGYARVDNVADRRYAGSVIVAESRGRFFEPAPGRNYAAGIEVGRSF